LHGSRWAHSDLAVFSYKDKDKALCPPGGAVQVDPMKPTLKPPGSKRLKPEHDKLLSNFAFNFNLGRYTPGQITATPSCWKRGKTN